MISRNKDKIILVLKKTCAYKLHMLKFITKMLNLLLNTLSCRHSQRFHKDAASTNYQLSDERFFKKKK